MPTSFLAHDRLLIVLEMAGAPNCHSPAQGDQSRALDLPQTLQRCHYQRRLEAD